MSEKLNLHTAKQLLEIIEKRATEQGVNAVIAICNACGNPIAVHCMDDSFLVSYDVATKKAYTAVAVKMSTMELSKLAQPGETFYGVDKLDGGRIVIFGGGIPLRAGDEIVGGLGISGGTGEQDHELALFGELAFRELLKC